MDRVVQHIRLQADEATRRRAAPRPASIGVNLDRRQRIVLSCMTCGGRNYRKTKARRESVEPLQLSKFCNICNAHTLHREAV